MHYDHPSDSVERGGPVLSSSDSHEFGRCGKFLFFIQDTSVYKPVSVSRCAREGQHSRPAMFVIRKLCS